ncbi:MAG: HlyC/CorC family transporter [Lentisphaeria bacterium]|nr:HlyC/CorC family transporter [Lentisphaeria bacterium]
MSDFPWTFWSGLAAYCVSIGFSATLIALSNLSGGRVRKLEADDRELAAKLDSWLNRRGEYRAFLRLLLIGIYVFIVFCAADVRHACAEVIEPLHIGLAVFCVVLLFFVLTEVLGRHQTLRGSATFLCRAMPLVQLLSRCLFVVSWIVFFCHRKGIDWREERSDEGGATAEDEIMSLVEYDADASEGDPSLEEDERRMIQGVFHLDEKLVDEIMTPRVDVNALPDTATVVEVRAEIVRSGHSRLPVYAETIDHVTGVVYAKDLLDEVRLAGIHSVGEISHRPVFVPETKNIGDLLEEFQRDRNHFAVVLDEYGGTAGIVSFEDILEEIVGEIQDEYDADEVHPTTEVLPDGTSVVDARMTIDELNEVLRTELPEDDDYDTLGGYISAAAGRIPIVGEVVETEHLVVEVLEADLRRVLKAKVSRRALGAPSGGQGSGGEDDD